MRRLTTITAILLGTLAIGCGGDSGSDEPAPAGETTAGVTGTTAVTDTGATGSATEETPADPAATAESGDEGAEEPVPVPADPATAGGTTLSKADFIEQADAACAKYNGAAEVIAASQNAMKSANGDEAAAHFDVLTERGQATLSELSGLTPPADLEADYRGYLAAETQSVAATKSLADALRAGEIDQFFALAEKLQKPSIRAARFASKLGLKSCGAT